MKKRQVSSAYDSNSEFTTCGISFTHKRKRRGPRIDPWGTPQAICPRDETSFSTLTIKDRFER